MIDNKLNIIITGASGMVGEGVLTECLDSNLVDKILIIGRRSANISHAKVREILIDDLMQISSIKDELLGYDTCFFCMGSTSIGKTAQEYELISYKIPMEFGKVLSEINPNMSFIYISGAGTDSTERGKIAWARVKGKTENELMKLPFKQVLAFRPGYLHPNKPLKNTLKMYKYIKWSYPLMKLIIPNRVSTLSELGKAMINSQLFPVNKRIIEVQDILQLSRMTNEK